MQERGEVRTWPDPIEDDRPRVLDLHMLVTERVPFGWLDACLDSLDLAFMRAPFGVCFYLGDEIVGDEWTARRRAYAAGSAAWVAHVDAGDWLAPDALAALWPAMQDDVDLVQSAAMRHDAVTGARTHTLRGLAVCRRILLDRVDWSNAAAVCCVQAALANAAGARRANVTNIGLHRRAGHLGLGCRACESRNDNAVG